MGTEAGNGQAAAAAPRGGWECLCSRVWVLGHAVMGPTGCIKSCSGLTRLKQIKKYKIYIMRSSYQNITRRQ